jgi:predicted Mrr-cat superfamily restriction endonuclease
MNYSTAVFLINSNVRAVNINYEPDKDGYKSSPKTTYKTFDKTIKVGDLVIVPSQTRYNMAVVKIVEVDVNPDLDSSTEMKWIIGKVDKDSYDEVLAKEKVAIEAIRSAERRRKIEDLRKSLILDQETLKTLSLSAEGS